MHLSFPTFEELKANLCANDRQNLFASRQSENLDFFEKYYAPKHSKVNIFLGGEYARIPYALSILNMNVTGVSQDFFVCVIHAQSQQNAIYQQKQLCSISWVRVLHHH